MSDQPLLFIVDDMPANIQVAMSHLEQLDCSFAYATSGEQALERIVASKPQLILMDVAMPGLDGFQTVEALKKQVETMDIPVIFLTARTEPEDIARGFKLGGVDYITKPFSGAELLARVRTHLELNAYRLDLETQVEERTHETNLLKSAVIEVMGELAEFRDPETGGHIKRTQHYVKALVSSLAEHDTFSAQIDSSYIDLLYRSAPLHDIGKVAIGDNILLKPGKLTDAEFEEMKKHSQYGESVIARLEKKVQGSSFLKYAREIAGSHHEKFNGQGYPRGLQGDEIPLAGRIMAIADVYDALVCKRVYKDAMPHSKAMAIMQEGRGTHFDPDIFDVFWDIEEVFQAIARRFLD